MSVKHVGHLIALGLAMGCGTGSGANTPPGDTGGNIGSGGLGSGGTSGSTAGTSNGGTSSTTGGTPAIGAAGALTGTGGTVLPGAGGVSSAGGATQPMGSGGVLIGSGGSPPQGGSGGAPSGGTAGTAEGGAAGAAGAGMDVCTRWKADRAMMSEGTWSGDVASCNAGDLSADARTNALRVLNLYRFIAGLPAVTDDPTQDAADQQCALMMKANNMLSHMPPTTWTCYTQTGADAANGSNIGTAPAVGSIDGYMLDPGNPTTLGHRRWVLSNSLGPIGIGGTNSTSCLMTLKGTGKAGKAWQAWPSPGNVPFQVIAATRFGSVDSTGWSLQSDTVNLASAQLTVTSDGAPLTVMVTQLGSGYGSRYAIRWNPMGWTTQAGKTYSVAVSGVTPPIAYDVTMVDCK